MGDRNADFRMGDDAVLLNGSQNSSHARSNVRPSSSLSLVPSSSELRQGIILFAHFITVASGHIPDSEHQCRVYFRQRRSTPRGNGWHVLKCTQSTKRKLSGEINLRPHWVQACICGRYSRPQTLPKYVQPLSSGTF